MKKDIDRLGSKKLGKRTVAVGVIGLLLIAGIGAATSILLHHLVPSTGEPVAVIFEATDDRSAHQREADHWVYGALADSQKMAESSDALLRLSDQASSNEEKVTYLSALVSLHEYARDYEMALEYANRLESVAQSHVSAAMIAELYFAKDDFSEAIHFYELAIDRTEPVDDPRNDSPYNDYMNLKKQAEERLL